MICRCWSIIKGEAINVRTESKSTNNIQEDIGPIATKFTIRSSNHDRALPQPPENGPDNTTMPEIPALLMHSFTFPCNQSINVNDHDRSLVPSIPIRPYCFVAMPTSPLALANATDATTSPTVNTISFAPAPIEFGVENCATHHVCSERRLFIELAQPTSKLRVQGIS